VAEPYILEEYERDSTDRAAELPGIVLTHAKRFE